MSQLHPKDVSRETLSAHDMSRTRAWGWLLLSLLAILGERVHYLFTSGFGLYADEAQYWSWAQAMEWGFYSKPPAVAAGIWFTTHLCGDGEACVRLSAPLVHGLTAVFLFLAALRLTRPAQALLAALLYLTLPAVWLSSALISTDVFLLCAWGLGLWCFIAALQTGGVRWWLGCGLALGLGLLSKYTMILFLASAFWWMLWHAEGRAQLRRPWPWLAACLGFALFLPNLYWNAQHDWVSFAHTQEIAKLDGALGSLKHMGEFLAAQLAVFGPLLFPLLLLMFARWRGLSQPVRLLLTFVWPMLLAITLQSFLSRAHANWAAAVYVPASLAVVLWAWEGKTRRQTLVMLSLLLHVAVGIGYHHYHRLLDGLSIEITKKRDPFVRLYGGRELGEYLLHVQASHPQSHLLADERKIAATLLYYTRGSGVQVQKWNYDTVMDDHYELTRTPTVADEGANYILVQTYPIRAELAAHFSQVTPLAPWEYRLASDASVTYYFYHLQGYRPHAVAQ